MELCSHGSYLYPKSQKTVQIAHNCKDLSEHELGGSSGQVPGLFEIVVHDIRRHLGLLFNLFDFFTSGLPYGVKMSATVPSRHSPSHHLRKNVQPAFIDFSGKAGTSLLLNLITAQ